MQCRGEGLALACVAAGAHVKFNQHLLVVVVGEELNAVNRCRNSAILAERPHRAYGLVDQRRADGTLLYRKQLVRSVAVVAELEARARVAPACACDCDTATAQPRALGSRLAGPAWRFGAGSRAGSQPCSEAGPRSRCAGTGSLRSGRNRGSRARRAQAKASRTWFSCARANPGRVSTRDDLDLFARE